MEGYRADLARHLERPDHEEVKAIYRRMHIEVRLYENKPQSTERARVRDLLKKQKGAPQNLG